MNPPIPLKPVWRQAGAGSVMDMKPDYEGEIKRLRGENAVLRAQLPSGMQGCTIRFKSCRKGHGWLTATNWVQHGCPTCARDVLRQALQPLADIAHIHDLYEGPPCHNPRAWGGLEVISAQHGDTKVGVTLGHCRKVQKLLKSS